MRVSYGGDTREAQRWLGKAQQELTRLQQRVTTQGLTQGHFHKILAPGVLCIGYILPNGLQTLDIVAAPTSGAEAETPAPRRDIHYFEFLTNGKPVEQQTVGDITGYRTAAVGVFVSAGGTLSAQFVRQQKVDLGTSPSLVGRMPQANLVDEPAFAWGSKVVLYESWAPNHPFTGVFARAYIAANTWGEFTSTVTKNRGYGRGMHSAFGSRDFGIDVPFQIGGGTSQVRPAFITDEGDADWPRASAIQTVVHPVYGMRRFAISVDASGRFYVFPVDVIEPPSGTDQNVDAAMVQFVDPTMPAWVFVPDQKLSAALVDHGVDTSMVRVPDMDWKVSRDGTKACLVALQREQAAFDTSFVRPDSLPFRGDFAAVGYSTLSHDQTYCLGEKQKFGSTITDDEDEEYWFNYAPGLIEATIDITLTSAELADFSVEITVATIRSPTEQEFCTLLAGYCWYDIKAEDWTAENDNHIAREGDLCVLDVERWWNPEMTSGTTGDDLYTAPSGAPPGSPTWGRRSIYFNGNTDYDPILIFYPDEEARLPYISFMALKNLTQETELRCFNSAAVIDYDFPTLSFAMLERYDEWSYGEYDTWGTEAWHYRLSPPGDPGWSPYDGTVMGGAPYPHEARQMVRHFGVSIFTQAALRKVLFPQSIPGEIETIITAATSVSPRDTIDGLTAGYELVPLNDMRDWSDSELQEFRFSICARGPSPIGSGTPGPNYAPFDSNLGVGNAQVHKGPFLLGTPYVWGSMPATEGILSRGGMGTRFTSYNDNPWAYVIHPYVEHFTTVPLIDWFVNALWTAAGPPVSTFYITPPYFSWVAYTDEILNRIMIAPSSTFFSHPNGSWAFYSPQFIYNRNPMVLDGVDWLIEQEPGSDYNTWLKHMPPSNKEPLELNAIIPRQGRPMQINTLDPFDVDLLEHCIFDWVHLVPTAGDAAESTFRELYNLAVAALPFDSTEELEEIDEDFLHATFTKQTVAHASYCGPANPTTVYPYITINFDTLDLKVMWQSNEYHYNEIGYFNLTTPGMTGSASYYPGTFIVDWGTVAGVACHAMDYGGHGLVDLTMGALFDDYALPDMAGGYTIFSSCLML